MVFGALIRTVSLLNVLLLRVEFCQTTLLEVEILTVPPLKIQPWQVPPVLMVKITPGERLKVQFVQVLKPSAPIIDELTLVGIL